MEAIFLPGAPGISGRTETQSSIARYVALRSILEQKSLRGYLGTVENEEDIDWESDDEDTAAPSTKSKSVTPADPPSAADNAPVIEASEDKPAPKLSAPSTPATDSPRRSESEDGSYDVVSSQVSNNGEAKEEEHSARKDVARASKPDRDDDEDSDWE